MPDDAPRATPCVACLSDSSVSAFAAGFVAVLVSLTGPLAIFYQAAQAARVSDSMFASWVWGISIAIAAITAAICTGREARADPSRRYVAGIASGMFYLLAGLCGGSIVMLFSALPKELVVTLVGLALVGPIAANLAGVLAADDHREAAVITFLATAPGMSFLGRRGRRPAS